MRKHFNYNFEEKAIIGSKAAINRANKGLNPEFRELSKMLAEHPEYSVQEKVINQKKDKQTYSNLTFDRMKEFISTKEDSKQRLLEFEAVKAVAAAKGAKYPLTKKWFLNTYPSFKENEVSEKESAEKEKALTAEAEKALSDAAAQLEALEADTETEQTEEAA